MGIALVFVARHENQGNPHKVLRIREDLNSLDKTELLKIFDREQRIEIEFPGVIRDVSERLIRNRMPNGERGFIAYSALNELTVEDEIDAQIEFFNSMGLSFEWKVYDHDQPADLRQRLAAKGFEIEPAEALMVLDLENAPDFYWTMELPQIVKITDQAGVDAVADMEEEVWKEDHSWLRSRLAHDLQHLPGLLSVFGIMADERVVSAAWIYYHPPSQFASLWGGSTLDAYRKRGYYSALLAVRAREARQRGFRFLTVDASPMSRPILEKHGFVFLGNSTPCVWNVKSREPNGGEND